jgi:DNA-binding FadR family transcriptional regulator
MNQEADSDPRFELKLDPGRPLPEVIADTLRGLVDDGTFKPGGRLPNESELARLLKVARSSVRTALQRLEAQGVLQVRRGLGWYVKRVAPAPAGSGPFDGRHYQTADLFEMRIGLEGLAASLAASRAEEGELADIAKRNDDYRAAGEAYEAGTAQDRDERLTELLHADLAFHHAIVAAARNEMLAESYRNVVGELQDWRVDSYKDGTVCRRSWREHEKIVRYLTAQDSGGARMAMNAHLQHLYDELPELPDVPLDTIEVALEEPEWHTR